MGWQPGPGKPLGKAVRVSRVCLQQPAQWALIRFPGTAHTEENGDPSEQPMRRREPRCAAGSTQRGNQISPSRPARTPLLPEHTRVPLMTKWTVTKQATALLLPCARGAVSAEATAAEIAGRNHADELSGQQAWRALTAPPRTLAK